MDDAGGRVPSALLKAPTRAAHLEVWRAKRTRDRDAPDPAESFCSAIPESPMRMRIIAPMLLFFVTGILVEALGVTNANESRVADLEVAR